MTDAAPEPIPLTHDEIVDLVKRNDQRAIVQAYQMTFSGSLGRLVLLHFLRACGVGQPVGAGATGEALQYAAGRSDAGLDLAAMAGFGPEAVAMITLTKDLEEDGELETHEPAYGIHEDDASLEFDR